MKQVSRFTIAALVTSLAFAPALAVVGDAAAAEKGKKAESEEHVVAMDQVPAPVKATIEKEAKGDTVGQVSKETEKGKTFYEVAIEKGGKQRYIHIAENGKVLKRESAKREAKEEQKEK